MAADSTPSPSRKRRATRALRKAGTSARAGIARIPGPSPNPATNLIIGDVAMRGLSMLAGRALQRAFLRTRYDREKAAEIVHGRSMLQTIVATSAARFASRSIPGFLLVSGGLLAKAALDRSFGKSRAQREGEKQLAEQADNAAEGTDA